MAVPERDGWDLGIKQMSFPHPLASETLAHGHQSFLNSVGEAEKL